MSRERLNGLRLLVVEDEALVAMLLKDALQGLGCAVVGPAGNVARALALLEREEVDLGLLDVNLGNGLKLENEAFGATFAEVTRSA
jgi:CheY-like chemotaxis protein